MPSTTAFVKRGGLTPAPHLPTLRSAMQDLARLLSNRSGALAARLDALAVAERAELVTALLELIADPARPLPERISAGNALGYLGDPRIDPLAPAMCAVPRGAFWMGTRVDEAPGVARRYGIPVGWMMKSTPRHEVVLDAYEIGRYPLTNLEFHAFLRDTGLGDPPAHWNGDAPPRFAANHPLHGVEWPRVLLYTEWLSDKTGRQYRVPIEAEWERAARGDDERAFPWGGRFSAVRCNTREGGVGGTTPVGIYPEGASPCGALDMAGNVEEFTADLYQPYPGTTFEDGDYGRYRMTRGGVYSLDADLARCDRRHGTPYAGPTGFRLARSAADEWLGRERPAG